MSRCLWQQTTASSKRPNTFSVLPRFPLALASPSRSPIVLRNVHYVSKQFLDIVSVVGLLLEVQPGQGEVMPVELLGLSVVVQVKVRVAQLAVDGAQHLQVLGSHLDGGFKEGDARPVVAHLAEPLTLQSEFQAGDLHPAADGGRGGSQRAKLLLFKCYFNFALQKSKKKSPKETGPSESLTDWPETAAH